MQSSEPEVTGTELLFKNFFMYKHKKKQKEVIYLSHDVSKKKQYWRLRDSKEGTALYLYESKQVVFCILFFLCEKENIQIMYFKEMFWYSPTAVRQDELLHILHFWSCIVSIRDSSE